jgi:hypothetical protein
VKKTALPYFFLILAVGVCALLRSEPALARDFMAGTVVSADLAKMEIEIIPGTLDSSGHDEGGGKSIRVRVTPESLVVNGRGELVFPGCVFPGGIVRLWGQREEGIFTATEIRGFGGRGDPTGVRRRLQRMGPCPGGPGFRGGQP